MPPKQAKRGYSAANDSFGMLGLQPLVSTVNQQEMNEHEGNMVYLARGFDLNALGLHLANNEPLHTSFASPWLDQPPKVQPDYKIPQCYAVTPPHLRYATFQKFALETLFYVFYSMPRDVLQLAAAQELYNREWRFHKELKCWLTRAPGTEPSVKQQKFERGSYVIFNPDTWTKEKKDDFVLTYEHLEEKTTSAGAQPQAQPQPPQ